MTFRMEHGNGAARMYRSRKHTIKQIAQFYGVREQTVSRTLHAMGVAIHPKGTWSKRKFSHEAAIVSYQSGKSLSVVAEEFSVDPKAILYVLRKHDIQPRARGGFRWKAKPDVPMIRTLLSRGFSRGRICELTGRSKYSIARIEGSLGAPARNSPRYQAWVAKLAREAA